MKSSETMEWPEYSPAVRIGNPKSIWNDYKRTKALISNFWGVWIMRGRGPIYSVKVGLNPRRIWISPRKRVWFSPWILAEIILNLMRIIMKLEVLDSLEKSLHWLVEKSLGINLWNSESFLDSDFAGLLFFPLSSFISWALRAFLGSD